MRANKDNSVRVRRPSRWREFVKVNAIGPLRSTLIDKGMIYSPSHGENAFTVPLFDGFLKRQLAIS